MVNSERLTRPATVRGALAEPRSSRGALVSVIVPCYNYGHFLPASVGSVLGQERVTAQVIIVDDASTDDSAAVAARIAAADPRVVVLRNRQNSGHVVTFNNGLAVATGDFIVRLDADDLLTPGSLARAVALFDAYPSVGLVYGHPLHFEGETPPEPSNRLKGWSVWPGEDWVARRCRTGVNCITTPEAVLRASVVAEMGPLNLRLKFAQDMEYWLRAASLSDVGRVDGPDQALHRDHAASMSVTTGSGKLLDLLERRTVFDEVFAGAGGALPRAAELHRTARRALAVDALELACHAFDRGKARTQDVSEFVDFARETYDPVEALPQWRALLRRQRVGAKVSPYVPTFFGAAVRRRLRHEVEHRRWVRTGV